MDDKELEAMFSLPEPPREMTLAEALKSWEPEFARHAALDARAALIRADMLEAPKTIQ